MKKLTKYSRCLLKNYGHSCLISERIVTPSKIDRAGYKWTREYKKSQQQKESTAERVNSRKSQQQKESTVSWMSSLELKSITYG